MVLLLPVCSWVKKPDDCVYTDSAGDQGFLLISLHTFIRLFGKMKDYKFFFSFCVNPKVPLECLGRMESPVTRLYSVVSSVSVLHLLLAGLV